MKIMLSKTYRALKSAGADDAAAQAAAEDVGEVAHELAVQRWMIGFMLALQVATLAFLYQIALRLA